MQGTKRLKGAHTRHVTPVGDTPHVGCATRDVVNRRLVARFIDLGEPGRAFRLDRAEHDEERHRKSSLLRGDVGVSCDHFASGNLRNVTNIDKWLTFDKYRHMGTWRIPRTLVQKPQMWPEWAHLGVQPTRFCPVRSIV